jgi:hypothetical protein
MSAASVAWAAMAAKRRCRRGMAVAVAWRASGNAATDYAPTGHCSVPLAGLSLQQRAQPQLPPPRPRPPLPRRPPTQPHPAWVRRPAVATRQSPSQSRTQRHRQASAWRSRAMLSARARLGVLAEVGLQPRKLARQRLLPRAAERLLTVRSQRRMPTTASGCAWTTPSAAASQAAAALAHRGCSPPAAPAASPAAAPWWPGRVCSAAPAVKRPRCGTPSHRPPMAAKAPENGAPLPRSKQVLPAGDHTASAVLQGQPQCIMLHAQRV